MKQTDTQRMMAAIAKWHTEMDNHDDKCVVYPNSRDCNGGHQEALDELEWGSEGILGTAQSLTGKPSQRASAVMKAAYEYRDVCNVLNEHEAKHKAHHRRYREVRNFLHLELGECDKCDDWSDLYEEYMKDAWGPDGTGPYYTARYAFENLY